jgi:hypothetical protein
VLWCNGPKWSVNSALSSLITGASTDGSEGGHLRPDLIDPDVLQEHGLELALEIASFEKAHLKAIKDVVEKEKIDCDLTFTRAWNVIMNEEASADIQKLMTTLSATGNDFFKDAKYIHGDKAAEV